MSKLDCRVIGIAMCDAEPDESVMIELNGIFFEPWSSGNQLDDFKSFTMPPIRHQEIVNYKCCGCSRFFGSKDYPRCPHCGAEAGAF